MIDPRAEHLKFIFIHEILKILKHIKKELT